MIVDGFFARLHGAAIRVQVPLVLSAVPIVAALYGVGVAPASVELLLEDEPHSTIVAARRAVAMVVAVLVACVAIATAGASLLLRGSLRSVVERIHDATGAIADGNFCHRIDSVRDDELGRLAESIDAMASRLERLEQARRRLLACVSHELRTPMTIIQGHAYTLQRAEQVPERRDRLVMMQDETRRLAGLVEDLVDASTLHAGGVQLRIERVDLVAIARGAQARFVAGSRARGVSINVEAARSSMAVDVDASRVEQVLANLVANAVRHARPGSVVQLHVGTARGGGGGCEVEVRNIGPAVPAAFVDQLFEPFAQCGGAKGRVGLGLAIAQGIMVAHGGRISFHQQAADDDHLVCFRCVLPRTQRALPEVVAELAAASMARRDQAPVPS